MNVRAGVGFDIHQTDRERPLILGGVRIDDAPFGLAGHSDADVLLHAIIDACLGALALGDIGRHFPDDDPQWKDADSKDLMRQVTALLQERGWMPGNVDVTVIAEHPKLAPWVEPMRVSIASILGCPTDAVSVKATTHEGLGALGAGEGIAAMAVALLFPRPEVDV
ncbi:2-C-methyl-D-erythritol 2,4-cyclodiphosphate synthase [Candidatus Zixiibacteriota bacterium]